MHTICVRVWGAGNEQDPGHSPQSEAEDFAVLHRLLLELYPLEQTRPKLIGPDIHGFHSGDFSSSKKDEAKLEFMVEFAGNCTRLGVPLYPRPHPQPHPPLWL